MTSNLKSWNTHKTHDIADHGNSGFYWKQICMCVIVRGCVCVRSTPLNELRTLPFNNSISNVNTFEQTIKNLHGFIVIS